MRVIGSWNSRLSVQDIPCAQALICTIYIILVAHFGFHPGVSACKPIGHLLSRAWCDHENYQPRRAFLAAAQSCSTCGHRRQCRLGIPETAAPHLSCERNLRTRPSAPSQEASSQAVAVSGAIFSSSVQWAHMRQLLADCSTANSFCGRCCFSACTSPRSPTLGQKSRGQVSVMCVPGSAWSRQPVNT